MRAALFYGKFPGYDKDNYQKLKIDFLDYLECVGDSDETQVCAANAGSFFKPDDWYVFIDGDGIAFHGNPKFVKPSGEDPNEDERQSVLEK